jgi:arylsulfatase A
LWVGDKKPSPDHPTGLSHRETLKMDWSRGHNATIHNGISRIGFYTGGQAARFRDEDLADEWVKQSVKWMEDNKDGPFFLFFASHDIHVPRMPHERFQGELMQTLKRLQLEQKTLVVFCSDNGPVLDDGYKDGAVEKIGDHKPAGPFRGGKYGITEGGTRTPFITHWPGTIPAGVSEEIVCTIDLAASFAALAGVKLTEDACLDSFNVLGALLGEAGAKGREHLIQQDNGQRGNFGFRVGNWKLHREAGKSEPALYNLSDDPGEFKNRASLNPEIARQLNEQLEQSIEAGRTRLAQ